MTPHSRNQVVPAVYIYLRRAGEVLLQRRQNTQFMNDRWAAGAAGHVEAGEGLREAAMREAAEELGVQIAAEDLRAQFSAYQRHARDPAPLAQRVDFVFCCSAWRGTPTIQEPHKAAALQWFSLESLPHDVSEYEAPFLAAVARAEVSGGSHDAFLDLAYDL